MKLATKYLKTRSGFTLVELMIATGILSVLMLGFTTYVYYQSRMSKHQEAKQNVAYVESSLLEAASQEESLSQSERLSK